MIKYALACAFEHEFEGWFASSDAYEEQRAGGDIACPLCGTLDVRKQIMAPSLAGTKAQAGGGGALTDRSRRTMVMEAMGRMRRHVLDTFDNVGDAFADEARAIHEGRSQERGIYGEASPPEVRDLIRDGVPVAPLPPEPPKKDELN